LIGVSNNRAVIHIIKDAVVIGVITRITVTVVVEVCYAITIGVSLTRITNTVIV